MRDRDEGPAVQDERAVHSVREVAELLTLSLGATYQLVRAGEIPARKVGSRWLIPKRRFHEWLDATELTDAARPRGVSATDWRF